MHQKCDGSKLNWISQLHNFVIEIWLQNYTTTFWLWVCATKISILTKINRATDTSFKIWSWTPIIVTRKTNYSYISYRYFNCFFIKHFDNYSKLQWNIFSKILYVLIFHNAFSSSFDACSVLPIIIFIFLFRTARFTWITLNGPWAECKGSCKGSSKRVRWHGIWRRRTRGWYNRL